jgi:outer membrane protein assembly factor BamD (BamD/ComL family)
VFPAPATTPPVTNGAVNGNTVPEQPVEITPYAYLERAREEYDAGRIVSAISYLDLFKEHFPLGSDEAWWLYGQSYEANSPARDILLALEYYRRLIRDYPQSTRANEARRRITYLERLYINIR